MIVIILMTCNRFDSQPIVELQNECGDGNVTRKRSKFEIIIFVGELHVFICQATVPGP